MIAFINNRINWIFLLLLIIAVLTAMKPPVNYEKRSTILKDSLVDKKGFIAYKDEAAKAPYLFNVETKQYISSDDEWSLANKCNHVLKNKLRGVMFGVYSSDQKGYLLNQVTKSFN